MKKTLQFLAAVLLIAPAAFAQTPSNANVAYRGVSFFTGVPATATQTLTAKLPNFSGSGVLTVTETGITGSPSACSITLKYQGNNAATAGAVVSTTSFTPSTGTQTFTITPVSPVGDSYVATYACTTYPTAGLITAAFSPADTTSLDPCFVSPKSTVSVSITTATTTQLVALAAGKTIYVCGFTATVGASSTIAFEYGTGSTCGTGTTALTGVFTPSTGAVLSLIGEGTKIAPPVSNALCALTTGTGGIYGYLNYTIQ
jgi:hypothetical protein